MAIGEVNSMFARQGMFSPFCRAAALATVAALALTMAAPSAAFAGPVYALAPVCGGPSYYGGSESGGPCVNGHPLGGW